MRCEIQGRLRNFYWKTSNHRTEARGIAENAFIGSESDRPSHCIRFNHAEADQLHLWRKMLLLSLGNHDIFHMVSLRFHSNSMLTAMGP